LNNIQNKEILQINSGIIAGALVFLTLSSIASTQEERFYRVSSILFGVLVIIAFSISSLRALYDEKNQALLVMRIGFFLLFAGGVVFALSNYVALLPP
jgi:hypothetical protein